MNEYEISFSYVDILKSCYNDVVDHYKFLSLFVDTEMITFKEFYVEFYAQDELSILEYTEYLINLLDQTNTELFDRLGRSSSGREWYYNTGTSLPQRPRYGRFNFDLIQFGDILFEAAGGGGTTGHIAIIEVSFFDSRFNVIYWRVIEAIPGVGVSRGILDEDRFVERRGQLLRVQSANTQTRRGAVNFDIQQLGSRYCLLVIGRPTSINQSRWHCCNISVSSIYESRNRYWS